MADALASGASSRKGVEVQILWRANLGGQAYGSGPHIARFGGSNPSLPTAANDMSIEKLKFHKELGEEEILENRLETRDIVEVERPDKPGEKLKVAYEIFDARKPEEIPPNDSLIVALSGWGGSLYQLSELAEYFAIKKRKRGIIVSNLGTGASSDLPKSWLRYKNRNFNYEAEVTKKAIEGIMGRNKKAKGGEKITVIGYSMGSIIAASLAEKYPDFVQNLILVHPVGLEKISVVELIRRFALTGGNEILRPLKKLCVPLFGEYPDEEIDPDVRKRKVKDFINNFLSGGRLEQRLVKDAMAIKEGLLKKILPNIKSNIFLIAGSADKYLFHPRKLKEMAKYCQNSSGVSYKIIEGAEHSFPMFYPQRYGEEITEFLKKIQ